MPGHSKSRLFLIIMIFLAAGLIRAIDVWRPIDGTTGDISGDLWREPDVGSIARNFYREGMNIFYPRIDWRGDGPGFVESEFPLYPWAVAGLYHIFGYHEELARVLSFILSLATCLVFFFLASALLPPVGAIAALTFFAFNPLSVKMATAVQPEPLMFLAYLMAAHYFIRWLDTESPLHYWVAFVATTLAILAKLPAIHIGLLFGILVIGKHGLRAVLRRDILVFASGTLLISLLWYLHARSLWIQYGNSLGMSNEAFVRISSLNFFWKAFLTIPGIIEIEINNVWMPAGIFLAVIGTRFIFSKPSYRLVLYWLVALGIFYFVTGRTTGESWATHYHIVSIPAAALLMGITMSALTQMKVHKGTWVISSRWVTAFGILFCGLGVIGFFHGFSSPIWREGELPKTIAFLGFVLMVSGVFMSLQGIIRYRENIDLSVDSRVRGAINCIVPVLLIVCFSATLGLETRKLINIIRARSKPNPLYGCAKRFQEKVPEGSLIVASGGPAIDRYGVPQGFNESYLFFWMDRKGFSISDEDQSLTRLEELRNRGAQFFIAGKSRIQSKVGLEDGLKTVFPLAAECETSLLFDLRQHNHR